MEASATPDEIERQPRAMNMRRSDFTAEQVGPSGPVTQGRAVGRLRPAAGPPAHHPKRSRAKRRATPAAPASRAPPEPGGERARVRAEGRAEAADPSEPCLPRFDMAVARPAQPISRRNVGRTGIRWARTRQPTSSPRTRDRASSRSSRSCSRRGRCNHCCSSQFRSSRNRTSWSSTGGSSTHSHDCHDGRTRCDRSGCRHGGALRTRRANRFLRLRRRHGCRMNVGLMNSRLTNDRMTSGRLTSDYPPSDRTTNGCPTNDQPTNGYLPSGRTTSDCPTSDSRANGFPTDGRDGLRRRGRRAPRYVRREHGHWARQLRPARRGARRT